MKTFPTVLILIKALLLYGCQEKISPKLENSNQVKETESDSNKITEGKELFHFRLINTADQVLGYKLHKTGEGHKDTPCSTGSNDPLKNSDFKSSGPRDLTCFLEAEELALFHSGLKFKIESAANTCSFVRYTPYSYYNRMPGDSTGNYYKVNCAEGITSDDISKITFAGFNKSQIETMNNAYPKCNEYVSTNILATERKSFEPASEDELCRFKYSDKGKENCDIGKISINEIQFYKEEKKGSTPLTYEYKTKAIPRREFSCGGKIMNCVKGPVKFETPVATAPTSYYISEQPKGVNFFMEKKYDGLIYQKEFKDTGSTYVYANYRRELAHSNIEYPKIYNLVRALKISVKKDEKKAIITSLIDPFPDLSEDEPIMLSGFSNSLFNQEAKFLTKGDANSIEIEFQEPSEMTLEESSNMGMLEQHVIQNKENSYANAFLDKKTFDPNVLDRYTKNYQINNNNFNILSQDRLKWYIEDDKYYRKPLASDPYLGEYPNHTHPFYTFECLDSSKEPLARIRLLVRDWDRIFSSDKNNESSEMSEDYSDFMENISDLFNVKNEEFNSYARMDYIPTLNSKYEDQFQIHDEHRYNDFPDWDDLLMMERIVKEDKLYYRPLYGLFNTNSFPETYSVE